MTKSYVRSTIIRSGIGAQSIQKQNLNIIIKIPRDARGLFWKNGVSSLQKLQKHKDYMPMTKLYLLCNRTWATRVEVIWNRCIDSISFSIPQAAVCVPSVCWLSTTPVCLCPGDCWTTALYLCSWWSSGFHRGNRTLIITKARVEKHGPDCPTLSVPSI